MFRSPIAKAFYNTYCGNLPKAESYGTWVDRDENAGKTLEKISRNTSLIYALQYMEEQGINISQEIAKQLTQDIAEKTDKIVVMTDRNSWPPYLANNLKVTYWNIENPEFLDIENTRRIGEEIKEKVMSLL